MSDRDDGTDRSNDTGRSTGTDRSNGGRPRVAFFDFTGCEGDQLQVINLEERLLDLADIVEIASFREASSADSDDYDIAFVEGSITTPHDAERLTEVRENADSIVTIGSCSSFGGINAMRNGEDQREVREEVYGDAADRFDDPDDDLFESFERAKPASDIVEVEHEIPGCPIDRDEFVQVVRALIEGVPPNVPNHPVCLECKFEENVCAFNRGQVCLGPITRGGCGADCIAEGTRCWGCRGTVDDPTIDAFTDVLEGTGYDLDDVRREFALYWGDEVSAEIAEPAEVVR
ncbi:MAG: NADH:ubiquinone oxidoreductase [Halococcoides sp.]